MWRVQSSRWGSAAAARRTHPILAVARVASSAIQRCSRRAGVERGARWNNPQSIRHRYDNSHRHILHCPSARHHPHTARSDSYSNMRHGHHDFRHRTPRFLPRYRPRTQERAGSGAGADWSSRRARRGTDSPDCCLSEAARSIMRSNSGHYCSGRCYSPGRRCYYLSDWSTMKRAHGRY